MEHIVFGRKMADWSKRAGSGQGVRLRWSQRAGSRQGLRLRWSQQTGSWQGLRLSCQGQIECSCIFCASKNPPESDRWLNVTWLTHSPGAVLLLCKDQEKVGLFCCIVPAMLIRTGQVFDEAVLLAGVGATAGKTIAVAAAEWLPVAGRSVPE